MIDASSDNGLCEDTVPIDCDNDHSFNDLQPLRCCGYDLQRSILLQQLLGWTGKLPSVPPSNLVPDEAKPLQPPCQGARIVVGVEETPHVAVLLPEDPGR